MSLLVAKGVSKSFGGLKAVQGFALELPERGLYGLIGPNGAGKTTVFNLLTGVYKPDEGSVRLGASGGGGGSGGGGRELTRLRPYQIAAEGMARTFQNIRLFGDLSVIDNLRVACHLRCPHGMPAAVLRLPSHRAQERALTQRCERLLEMFNLHTRAHEQARNLPYGDQRRLEIARAIATGPKVLLLDEPAAGMNPQEKKELRTLIRSVRDTFQLAVLLIEHDMGVVMDLCERITVLDYGKIIAHGPPEQVQKDPKVIEAYLGAPAA